MSLSAHKQKENLSDIIKATMIKHLIMIIYLGILGFCTTEFKCEDLKQLKIYYFKFMRKP